MGSAKQTLNELIATNELPNSWNYCGAIGSLFIFSFVKPLFTAASTSVQIPGGVILPIFISGACLGRLLY